jgi:hypothetical protein
LGMTFDQGHNLWVADLRAGNNGALFKYSADQLSTGGVQVPNLIVSSASLRQPETVVVDQSGNLWTVNCGNATLQMFAAGDLVGSGTTNLRRRSRLAPPIAPPRTLRAWTVKRGWHWIVQAACGWQTTIAKTSAAWSGSRPNSSSRAEIRLL